jgi:hypothetical protein
MRLQILIVLLAITMASVQCVARCAAMPCHAEADVHPSSHLPPCHRHAPPTPHAPVEACQYLLLSSGKASPVFDLQLLSCDIVVAVPIHSAPGLFRQTEQALTEMAGPPGSAQLPLLSVLRI